MANVVVADPVFLAREGFKALIEENRNFTFTGEITSGDDFLPLLKELKPDLLVVGFDSNGFVDIDDIRSAKEVSADTNILVISNDRKKENILKIISNGALGYLTRQCGRNEIIDALNSVLKNEKFFCSKILDIILDKNSDPKDPGTELTEREIEIIKLIAEKYSNTEIAEKLFISIHTVYTHRRNIMKKLELKSPVELILYAIDNGIIDAYQN